MKRLGLVLATLLFASCSVLGEPRDWNFVQSVGGISVGQPTKSAAGWLLPVQANVSGLQAFTVKPTMLNSALSCRSVKATINGSSIYLTIITGVVGGRYNAACPSAELGQLTLGAYAVFYRDPDGKAIRLRDIAVGR